MKTLLRRERLPLPPIPKTFHNHIAKLRPWAWGTREETHSLYDVEAYVEDEINPNHQHQQPQQDYVLVGHAGYGSNSWFFHSFISTGQLAVFVQAPWGGAYCNAKHAVEGLKVRFDLMEKLIHGTDRAMEKGIQLPGRLIVQQSSMAAPRWAWVRQHEPVIWREEFANAMTPALESLQGYL